MRGREPGALDRVAFAPDTQHQVRHRGALDVGILEEAGRHAALTVDDERARDGHADHARGGHGHVFATPETLAIMGVRYGDQNGNPVNYGESFRVGEVDVRLVPAGHVLGSAQIVLEHAGEIGRAHV